MVALLATSTLAHSGDGLNFSRDVLPILSENCFACHGPDVADRKSDLRLDDREQLLKAVSLGTPMESELLVRVRSKDAEVLMPPPASHKKPLSAEQIDILERWIEDGATWGKHWAFEPPVKVSLSEDGGKHPIDALIATLLAKKGLQPSPTAPPHTLQRRLSLDLIGLPPSVDAIPFDGSDVANAIRISSIRSRMQTTIALPPFLIVSMKMARQAIALNRT